MGVTTRSPRAPTLLLLLILGCAAAAAHEEAWLMPVRHKFDGQRPSLEVLRAHDARRHGRSLLGGIDMDVAGKPKFTSNGPGFYFTELELGTPPRNYSFQIESTRSLMWVYCDPSPETPSCPDCTEIYMTNQSTTQRRLGCFAEACKHYGDLSCDQNEFCNFSASYFDQTQISGYIIMDYVKYGLESADGERANMNMTFGCASDNDEVNFVGGALGFGRLNTSMISQLASAGKTKKAFAHCLDTANGGGIFAIGRVVEPHVNTTPLIPATEEYKVIIKQIEISEEQFAQEHVALFDSGTILSYVPRNVYEKILFAVFREHQYLRFHERENDQCFRYTGSLDDDFPNVILHFEKLSMVVFPHDYFYSYEQQESIWCFGWQPTDLKDSNNFPIIIFGAMTLTNKLVFYDLEKEAIGWTDYNCSKSIKIGVEGTNKTYTVESHIASLANNCKGSRFVILSLLLNAMLLYVNL